MPAFMLDQRANFQALILLDALEDENTNDIHSILEKNQVDASYVPSERGVAPLHYACSMKNGELALDVVRRLLKGGADANVRSNEEMTPLHVAAIMGRADLVRVLLEFGARADLLDAERRTPVHYAIEKCHFEVLQLLREHMNKQNCAEQGQRAECELVAATPKRLHYNFDTKSPYYINITHRRHRPQPSFPTSADAAKEQTNKQAAKPQSAVNMFALTKTNLEELSHSTKTMEHSCMALIEAWREKVQRSRDRRSILRQFDDIDVMLNEVMESDHLNFTNTVLREKAPSEQQEAETTIKRSLLSNMSLGALIQRAAQAHLVNEDTKPMEQSTRPTKTKSSSRPEPERQLIEEAKENTKQQRQLGANVVPASSAEYFLQMTETYVHTDDDYGLVFYETKLLSNQEEAEQSESIITPRTNVAKPLENETVAPHSELPITIAHSTAEPKVKSTKRLYIKRLIKYKRKTPLTTMNGQKTGIKVAIDFSVELSHTIRSNESFRRIPQYAQYGAQLKLYFANQQLRPNMREGASKLSFIYMLLDPRMSCNLPGESVFLDRFTIWTRFLHSVFYVGIGKSTRPFAQLYEAMKLHSRLRSKAKKTNRNDRSGLVQNSTPSLVPSILKTVQIDKKLQRILDVWSSGSGVVCLRVFNDLLPAEVHTFEAAIIDALGLQHLSNVKRGDYYGPAQTWTMKEKKYLGISLLHTALQTYLAEGESQLSPSDLI